MTNEVLARGNNWSQNYLNDGWGDETPDKWISILVDEVTTRFQYKLDSLGINASWYPSTSEVIGERSSMGDWSSANLGEFRDRIIDAVWNEFIDGELDHLLDLQ